MYQNVDNGEQCMHLCLHIIDMTECTPLCLGWSRECACVCLVCTVRSKSDPPWGQCLCHYLLVLSDYQRQAIKSGLEKVACNEALLFPLTFPLCITPTAPSLLPVRLSYLISDLGLAIKEFGFSVRVPQNRGMLHNKWGGRNRTRKIN